MIGECSIPTRILCICLAMGCSSDAAVEPSTGTELTLSNSAPSEAPDDTSPSPNPEPLDPAHFHALDTPHQDEARTFFDLALTQLGIPGGAFLLVEDGRVTLSHASGIARLGADIPVRSETRFRIASLTKPLSAAAVSSLVSTGAVSLDASIATLLGGNARPDLPVFPDGLTLRDTLCACVGLVRRDAPLVYRGSSELPRTLGDLTLRSQRTPGQFGYSNQAFSLGMYAVVAGRGAHDVVAQFPAFLQELVFDPLSMTQTSLVEATDPIGVRAQGHALDSDGNYVPVADHIHAGLSRVIPAAGGWSTIDDMGKFLAHEAGSDHGSDGDAANGDPRRRIHVLTSPGTAYGLGWFIDDGRGLRILSHRGDAVGYTADLMLMPDQRTGVVVLLNAGAASGLTELFRQKLLSLWFGITDDSAGGLEALTDTRRRDATREHAERQWPTPELARDIVGRYVNPLLGEITITRVDDRLLFTTESWTSALSSIAGEGQSLGHLVFLDPPLSTQRLEIIDTHTLRYGTYFFSRRRSQAADRGP